MSKSLGNVVDPTDWAPYGVDQLRYSSCCARSAFGQDGSYSHEAIVSRVNADLANSFGNLAQRSLTMVAKNCDRPGSHPRRAVPSEDDRALLA